MFCCRMCFEGAAPKLQLRLIVSEILVSTPIEAEAQRLDLYVRLFVLLFSLYIPRFTNIHQETWFNLWGD
jgi:hypothetical protein